MVEDLSASDMLALDSHFQQCRSCASKAHELDRLSNDLTLLGDTIARSDAPFTFDPEREDVHVHRSIPWMRLFAQGSVAAAALIALLLLVIYEFPRGNNARQKVVTAVSESEPMILTRTFRTPPVAIDKTPPAPGMYQFGKSRVQSPSFVRPASDYRANTADIGTPSITIGSAFRRLKNDRFNKRIIN